MSVCDWSSHSDADGQAHKAALYEQTLLNKCFYFEAQNFCQHQELDSISSGAWKQKKGKTNKQKNNDLCPNKGAFSTNESLMSCRLVTFQQVSNFILLLCLFLQPCRRWGAVHPAPNHFYCKGLKIIKTIKSKWRVTQRTSTSSTNSWPEFNMSFFKAPPLCGPSNMQL